jgi:hypothetical protein
MKQLPRPRKTVSTLSGSINRQLKMYALAADAAGVSALASVRSAEAKIVRYALAASVVGVGALASVQSVEAKIVYTPANINLPNGYYSPTVFLDLNRDGQDDFRFYGLGTCNSGCTFDVDIAGLVSGNEIIGTKHQQRIRPNAVAMRTGAQIGPTRHFYASGAIASVVTNPFKSSQRWYGQWGNGGKGLKNRYLGLKFAIKGKTHFGWARVTVKTSVDTFTATLTGYAYETIPNKSIIAGDKKGSSSISPATLGVLALGRF